MGEPIIASNQYDDFRGTVAIDMFGGGDNLLGDLAARVEVPKGYWPVGFSVYADGSGPKHYPGVESPSFSLTVYATDAEVTGVTGDSLRDFAERHDAVPVFRFSERIGGAELFALLAKHIKRFDMVLATRTIEASPMVEVHDS